MKLLVQIGIVFGICWASQWIESVLPITFPASVIGLIVLLVLLLTRVLKVSQIQQVSDFLLGNLPFLFIPAVVSIMDYVDIISANLVEFLAVCVVSLFLVYGATAWTVKLTMKLMKSKEDGEK